MEETAAADAAIYVDLSRLAVRGLGRASTAEYAIAIAASIAAHLTRRQNRVRLFARGARPYDVPPGSGTLQLARILEALAVARAGGSLRLAALLEETAGELSRGASAVVIASSLDFDLAECAGVLAIHRARGVHVVAVLIDARTFLKVFDEQAAVEQAAPELSEVAAALMSEGATVYRIARGDDIALRLFCPLGTEPPP
jgi:uncharacterized protein (DUF58 family)